MEIKVKRVGVDKDTRHTSINVGGPPPSMIFASQLKVQESDRDKGRDNDQQHKGQKENTEERVDLVSPHGRKDVMQFNVNGGKGKKSSNQDLEGAATVPRNLGWDLTSHLGCSGRCIKVGIGVILCHDTSEYQQGKGNKDVQSRHG